jgi:hypothetical protein
MALAAVVAAVTLPACCIFGKDCCRKRPLYSTDSRAIPDATGITVVAVDGPPVELAGPPVATRSLAKELPGADKPPSPAPKKSEYGKRGGRAGAAPAEAPIEVQ